MTLPFIIEPAELEAALEQPDLLIWDLGKAETYQQAHVPNALHVNGKDITLGMPPAPGLLPPKEQLSLLFGHLGLTADKHVVVYDDEGGPWAGRMIWVLDSIGHQKYSFLNGGIHSWIAEQRPISRVPHSVEASDYQVDVVHEAFTATADEILADVNGTAPTLDIWDVRTPAEFSGEKVLSQRGGHIPGAKHYEWTQALDTEHHLRLRKTEEIQQELAALGIQGDKTVVTHCQTHRRSGLSYVIAKHLGWQVKAYAGSWSEWGNLPNTPVEVGH